MKPLISDVPLKYRIKKVGKYNAYVHICPNCLDYNKDLITLGFNEFEGNVIRIIECPICFKKFWHHIKQKDLLETYLLELKILRK